MKKFKRHIPWAFLDSWRGRDFAGQWPTVPEMFKITAKRYPDRPCFTDFDPEKITRTYREVVANCTKLATWMITMGLKKDDHVAVSGKNSSEWATVYLATLFAGGIIVPIDYGLHDAEISNLLKTAEPKFLFIDEEKYDLFSAKAMGEKVFSLSKNHADRYVYNLSPQASGTEQPANERHHRVGSLCSENDTAAIMFTSGTTGFPRGVVLSHKNLVSDCYISQVNLDLFPTDVFYALLPIHHAYTMLAVFLEAVSVGAEVVFGKTMAITRMLKELREGKITMLLGVPLLFNKLLAGILKGIREKGIFVFALMKLLMAVSYLVKKLTGRNPGKKIFKAVLEKASISTIRIAICGGGPLAKSVFRVYNELGIDFIQGYGLTETSPIIALNPIEHFKVASVGQFFAPYMDMKIIHSDASKGNSAIGEVAVKGPMVMRGYYKMPEETRAMFTEDGWFKTGDLGRLDKEGYLYLAGRAKNMIVTEGGKNVYPEEIENAFQLYTDIEQITVRGYMMEKSTKAEGIEALVYPADDLLKSLDVSRSEAHLSVAVNKAIESCIDKVNRMLPPYARISHLVILDELLEMTTTKKVKRDF